jgi:hypothetical protein
MMKAPCEARALDAAMPMFAGETLAAQLDASLTQERIDFLHGNRGA